MMHVHTANAHYLLYYSKIKTKPRQHRHSSSYDVFSHSKSLLHASLLWNQDKAQTETIFHDMTCGGCLSREQTVGRILHQGVRASHTQRPPPQPATLCRPQPGPTRQRAQQPALPRSTADTDRNLVSQPNFSSHLFSPVSNCSCCPCGCCCAVRSLPFSSIGNTSCDVQAGDGAAGGCSCFCCCCFNGSCESSSCSYPLVSNSTIKLFSVLNCCCCCCDCC